jgi:hypothetical protein
MAIKINQPLPLQALKKITYIRSFGLKINHLATLGVNVIIFRRTLVTFAENSDCNVDTLGRSD